MTLESINKRFKYTPDIEVLYFNTVDELANAIGSVVFYSVAYH